MTLIMTKANINWTDYKLQNNAGGGDCGVYSIKDALGLKEDIQTIRNIIIEKVIAIHKLNTAQDNNILKDSYKKLFDNNWVLFQKFADYVITSKLNSQNDYQKAQSSLPALQKIINLANLWDDHSLEWDKIKVKVDFNVSFHSICQDHRIYKSFTIEKYQQKASRKGVWLNNHEINAFLISKGYIFHQQHQDIQKFGGTILEYQSCYLPQFSIFIHNNGQDRGNGAAKGSHWQALLLKSGEKPPLQNFQTQKEGSPENSANIVEENNSDNNTSFSTPTNYETNIIDDLVYFEVTSKSEINGFFYDTLAHSLEVKNNYVQITDDIGKIFDISIGYQAYNEVWFELLGEKGNEIEFNNDYAKFLSGILAA